MHAEVSQIVQPDENIHLAGGAPGSREGDDVAGIVVLFPRDLVAPNAVGEPRVESGGRSPSAAVRVADRGDSLGAGRGGEGAGRRGMREAGGDGPAPASVRGDGHARRVQHGAEAAGKIERVRSAIGGDGRRIVRIDGGTWTSMARIAPVGGRRENKTR